MGNQESESMKLPPLMMKIKNALNVCEQEGKNRTGSLIHHIFSSSFIKPHQSYQMQRTMNPFCPLIIQDQAGWGTGCLISPKMIFCSPHYICKKEDGTIMALPVYKDVIHPIKIQEILMIPGEQMCLAVLEKPFWKAGWAGITYIKDINELKDQNLKVIDHPKKRLYEQYPSSIHIQMVNKFVIEKWKKKQEINGLKIPVKGEVGSIICKVLDKKPYIIGIQTSDTEATFISFTDYQNITKCAKNYFRKFNRERETMKQMDIVQFQKQIMW